MYAVPTHWPEHHEAAWEAAIVLTYFTCGFVVARWWAGLLALGPILLAVPRGVHGDVDGTPMWWWVLVDTAMIFVWVTLAGVAVGKLVRRWRGPEASATRT
jgi:hypothetical protein